ncbi:MAG: geranyl transferase [Pseudomonadales bacterium]|nr:geranyl transferase [Pseudomonadales bacterium]
MVTNLADLKVRIDSALAEYLPTDSAIAQDVVDAMRHGVLGGGKRLRPMLACATAQASGANPEVALSSGCATEFIHAYSLIHDDLPAMDDDELRHGLPSAHVAFGEATAILAGDSLHSMAFQLIAQDHDLAAETRIEMISLLSQAAGWAGMAGGQCLDIMAEGENLSLSELKALHAAKTGALIKASVQLGYLSACGTTAGDPKFTLLSDYGEQIGLAFQVMDDVLDVTQSTEQLGKPAGSDEALEKNTFPKLMGLDAAVVFAADLIGEAKSKIEFLGEDGRLLADLAELVVNRNH